MSTLSPRRAFALADLAVAAAFVVLGILSVVPARVALFGGLGWAALALLCALPLSNVADRAASR